MALELSIYLNVASGGVSEFCVIGPEIAVIGFRRRSTFPELHLYLLLFTYM
jgi:hypothetical protein